MTTSIQERSPKKMLKVSFGDNDIVCYNNSTETFIEVLSRLSIEQLEKINLEIGHLPMISREIYPKYKGYMKPIGNGLYVNTQSNTDQKYLQLLSIKQQLNLDFVVETGTDFQCTKSKTEKKPKKDKEKLLVKLPNGEYLGDDNPIDTYLNAFWEMGIDEIQRKDLVFGNKKLITLTKQYNNQIQVGNKQWLTVPPQTKDKRKWLIITAALMHLNIEVSII